MDINTLSLGFDEKLNFALRGLYEKNGYSHYRMSKFEEYDLYARNKDFLISDSVITFTDMDGRLLALKPDVTLSIIKNLTVPEGSTRKLYYNENVYRVTKGNRSFKEIMQTGLECFGNIDAYSLCEVITLAAESLSIISPDCILDISNLDLISNILDSIGLDTAKREEFLYLVGEKNTHELSVLLNEAEIPSEKAEKIIEAVSCYGDAEAVIPKIKDLLNGIADTSPLNLLSDIIAALSPVLREKVKIDFSVVDNTKYYNGIVFKGFINGVPSAVLSGGQYNRLMKRLGRNCGAVGFAVYNDTLERLYEEQNKYDANVLLIYENCDLAFLRKTVCELQEKFGSVCAQSAIPASGNFQKKFTLKGTTLKEIIDNA